MRFTQNIEYDYELITQQDLEVIGGGSLFAVDKNKAIKEICKLHRLVNIGSGEYIKDNIYYFIRFK